MSFYTNEGSLTSQVEQMRINGDGNVGIGTTTPLAKLDIQGTQGQLFSVTDDLSGSIFAVADISGVPIFDVNSSGVSTFDGDVDIKTSFGGSNFYQLGVGTTSSGSIYTEGRIFCGGTSFTDGEAIFNDKVGIGTTNPQRLLSISNNDATTTPQLLITQNGSGDAVIGFNRPGHQGWAMGIDSSIGNNFEIHNSSGGVDSSSQLAITPGGNVGIGTTSPGAKLDVVGDVYLRQTTFTNIVRPYSTQQLTLLGGGANTLFINGNVGIGTTSPTSALGSTKVLDISSTGNGEVILDHTDAGTGSDLGLYSWARSNDHLAHIKATCEGATDAAFISFHAQPSGGSFTNAASNEKMRISSSGNVTIQGTTTATNFILSSDERLKENIEKACDNRIKADWKTFELKTDKGQKRYGVIAQELEKTNPEFVREDTQGFKSVAYIDLLIAKIAELEARLEKAGI